MKDLSTYITEGVLGNPKDIMTAGDKVAREQFIQDILKK